MAIDLKRYLVDELGNEVFDVLNSTLSDDDYAKGNYNEVLVSSGKEKVSEAILKALGSEVDFYETISRELIAKIEIYNSLRDVLHIAVEEKDSLSLKMDQLRSELSSATEDLKKVQALYKAFKANK